MRVRCSQDIVKDVSMKPTKTNTANKNYQGALKETSDYPAKNQTLTEHFDHSQNLLMRGIKARLEVSEFKRL